MVEVEIYGKKKTVAAWAKLCGVSRQRMHQRIQQHGAEQAILYYAAARKACGNPRVEIKTPKELWLLNGGADGAPSRKRSVRRGGTEKGDRARAQGTVRAREKRTAAQDA